MKWLEEVVLESANVKLVPINENHKEDLVTAASDGNLSDIWYTSIPSSTTIDSYLTKAINDFKEDRGLAFVVIDKHSNKIIGSTRYANAAPENRRLEVGYTWYGRSYQKTYVNPECKLLLLTHAFEELKVIAVELRTHWYNFQSRNAISKLGAKQDGVLRNHLIMPDGTIRDTVVFSIIESEWQTCKRSLQYRIDNIHGTD